MRSFHRHGSGLYRPSRTPMNKDVHYTDAEAKDLGIVEGPAAMNALAVIDFADAAQHMPEWDQTFRSEVATLSN